MAFPIPAHLPRRPSPQDVSSQILSQIDSATNKSLNSALATSWLVQLEDTIQSTKERIHERVQTNLPEFEWQLVSSKSVQTRLQSLATNVNILGDAVSNPKTGIISTLLENLTSHANLTQTAVDAQVKYETLDQLLQFKTQLRSLMSLIEAGELPEAVGACETLSTVIEEAPAHMSNAKVMVDVKDKFRAAKARTEEQLTDSLSRSITTSPKNLTILSSVQVRQSESVLSLPSILSSLSTSSLSNQLTILRRDFTSYFIDHLLIHPTTVMISSEGLKHEISHFPSPPNEEVYETRLDNLSTTLTFLSTHFFSCLPPSQRILFTRSLCKPITTSILNNLLIALLPKSFERLPSFLGLVRQAVTFEEHFIIGMLGSDPHDRAIKTWADSVSGHYERQRRSHILDLSRKTIISSEGPAEFFLTEIELPPENNSTDVPIQVEEETSEGIKDDSWGFDEDATGTGSTLEVDDDGWGFDDDVILDSDSNSQPERKADEPSPSPEIINTEDEPDPSGAWGWNDDDEIPPAEETAWDDPWGDEPSTSDFTTDLHPHPEPTIALPKAATRLEKAANKGKKQVNGVSSINPPVAPPLSNGLSQPTSHSALSSINGELVPPSSGKRPTRLTMGVKESYAVSERMKQIIQLVEDVLNEGRQFTSSKLFPLSGTSSKPGTIILQSAPAVFDLYIALYPVKFVKDLHSPERGMRFSNDCLYLSKELERIDKASSDIGVVRERFSEHKHHLKIWSDNWYYDVIQYQQQSIDKILEEGAQGFAYTGNQDRYDECEMAITQALKEIRHFAQRVKGVLAKSKYYTAIGMVTNAALSKILQDVLALPDIPEVESHKLSELCRIFNALEGLFVEDPSQPSFVVAYVPSWLKFSYLSELLEASMADITYLFEEGALVDFEVEQLVRLVRALFADTALRTTTINKILSGHPKLPQ